MEFSQSFNQVFIHLFTSLLCTGKILLVTSKKNTTQAVLAREKEFIGSRTWKVQEFNWLPTLGT